MRGTDAFPQVLEEARRRAGGAGVEIDFEATPVEQLDPARHAAELIVCCEVLEHLEDPERALDVLGRPGEAVADRERPPRAALAGAQPGAPLLRRRSRQHTRPPEPLVEAGLREVSHPPLRGSRDQKPDTVDHGPLPRTIAAFMRRLRQSLQRSSPAPASPPSSPSASPGDSSCTRWAGRRWPTSTRCRPSPRARPRSTSGTGTPTTRPGSNGHFYSVKSPGMAALTHSALHGDRGPRRGQARPGRGEQRRADGASEVDPGDTVIPLENYGYNVERGMRVQRIVEESTRRSSGLSRCSPR